MGLTYHFSFGAPNAVSADELEEFLRDVEQEAIQMGFGPTTVMNGPFDTAERREFAKRVARGIPFEDERLKGVSLPSAQYWSHNPATGSCRVAPEHGVVLVLTDSHRRETVFGFFRHPAVVRDAGGRVVADAGYLTSELDE